MYTGKKILITGGTGTIGRMLVERLLHFNPQVIRILSRDEHKQYEMQQEYSNTSKLRFLIGDIRDLQRLNRAMEDIDFVFHLAAMKHVPSCEYNPFEAVQTNVIGTQNVIQSAINNDVQKVLFTSTDKAIAPTNAYGATKLTAERLISAAEYQKGPKKTKFASVRFGNVMGSRGSVIPFFKKQILENRCVPVTDLKMIRYMMTPKQAVSLLLQANEYAQGGEVFVLKMPLVKLSDLVEIIKEEMSIKYNIKEEIRIKEIGLRPGEKMYEELMTNDESLNCIETPYMYIIPPLFAEKDYQYENMMAPTLQYHFDDKLITKQTLKEWVLSENLL
ncbi:polysaccharide biosynthesis protein [Brevibacillus agri]|uniref:UDP-N-acetylglucosamine 4,6-dehydratase family protein n=1 Tax=Brevibacillus agri TaxID=51101 RepID=UPI002E1BF3EC|nr:polysaccharide biosynthesis protein [Brevibacillus agri]MED1655878.1 polysaccharide biosynthesis protein [Brevibacillus agri]MED1685013.1 polysaccharide biosynthesis protein [Brevibacillus agri]MED1693614.1 polysaccharide biosynthesis protein [Brevibacillus agri]MED1697572.1 polysaccharide biosynthesis protein [Brevibacillus agri]